MSIIIDFLKNNFWVAELIGLIVSIIFFLIGIFSENKYNFINRIKRVFARAINKSASLELAMEFTPLKNKSFSNIKSIIKNTFRSSNYEITRDSTTRLDLISGIFFIKIIEKPNKNIFLEVKRMSAGIRSLRGRVENFLKIIKQFSSIKSPNYIFDSFIDCELKVTLPYTWSYININPPKKFEIKNYNINFKEKTTDSQIPATEISVQSKKLVAIVDAKEDLIPLLHKLL